MVLDLNALKQELLDTKNQFNSTRQDLELERKHKLTLISRLEATNGKLTQLEEINKRASGDQESKLYSEAVQNAQREELNLKQIRDLEEEKLSFQNEMRDLRQKLLQQMEDNKVLKITLDETQQELENLISEHEALTGQLSDTQSQLREAQEQPGKLRLEAQSIRDQLYQKQEEVDALQRNMQQVSAQTQQETDAVKQIRARNN